MIGFIKDKPSAPSLDFSTFLTLCYFCAGADIQGSYVVSHKTVDSYLDDFEEHGEHVMNTSLQFLQRKGFLKIRKTAVEIGYVKDGFIYLYCNEDEKKKESIMEPLNSFLPPFKHYCEKIGKKYLGESVPAFFIEIEAKLGRTGFIASPRDYADFFCAVCHITQLTEYPEPSRTDVAILKNSFKRFQTRVAYSLIIHYFSNLSKYSKTPSLKNFIYHLDKIYLDLNSRKTVTKEYMRDEVNNEDKF